MKSMTKQVQGEELFVGIDLHKRRWHVTIRTADVEIFSNSIVGRWEDLRRVINRYKGCRIHAVYEAGYFGFWLFDHLTKFGVQCIVTPPSLIPHEHGMREYFVGIKRSIAGHDDKWMAVYSHPVF